MLFAHTLQIQVLTVFYIKLYSHVEFIYFKKATEFCEISTVDMSCVSNCQIYGGDFAKVCCLPKMCELYLVNEQPRFLSFEFLRPRAAPRPPVLLAYVHTYLHAYAINKKIRQPTYGNTGNGVSSPGIQN